ncbi:UNVERIFIED_CONTAM: hypothetical protein FKN15_073681 [Acipenser sinensis]
MVTFPTFNIASPWPPLGSLRKSLKGGGKKGLPEDPGPPFRLPRLRPNRKLDCPIQGCLRRCVVKLDRHFQRIHGLKCSDPSYATFMSEAKCRQAGALSNTETETRVSLTNLCIQAEPEAAAASSSEEDNPGGPQPLTPRLRLYFQYLTSPRPTPKKRENSLQAAQHVRLFLSFMTDVFPGEAFADNLAFLKNTERCQL